MTNTPTPANWRHRVLQALVLLLVVALGARVAADLLAPLIPLIVVAVLLAAICWFVLRRRYP